MEKEDAAHLLCRQRPFRVMDGGTARPTWPPPPPCRVRLAPRPSQRARSAVEDDDDDEEGG